jgi:ribonuclease P/MRP protein subunit POP1
MRVCGWRKERNGLRIVEPFAFEREAPHRLIAPLAIIWCSESTSEQHDVVHLEKRRRKAFLRVHPSAFYELWEEVVRLSKVAKPSVRVEDLRFEIGSIQITGPGSTEALLGALWPNASTAETTKPPASSHADTWRALSGVTDPSALPSGALLSFTIQDPRLHHPPRTIKLRTSQDEQSQLLEVISKWPIDQAEKVAQIFDRSKRLRGSKLASQKAINRRRSQANPGEYPAASPADLEIPILLHTSLLTATAGKRQGQASWTLLAPWKTIQPIWYSLMYYPLSTGQQPRFGGLREQQQLTFEAQRPWFPADFPGTKAGWDWEIVERRRRWDEWNKRPKGKRTSWEKVDMGNGKKGEVGEGWSCDWTMLLTGKCDTSESDVPGARAEKEGQETDVGITKEAFLAEPPKPPSRPELLSQISPGEALRLFRTVPVATLDGKLVAVRINLINRGVPQTCARIYRLPSPESDPKLRKAWLNLQPTGQRQRKLSVGKSKHAPPRLPKDVTPYVAQQRLALSLLQSPRGCEDDYPACPDVEDLIGFVTTGNFNLAEGRGTSIGNVLLEKVVDRVAQNIDEGRLCIVRNAGANFGRLARWEIAT